MTAPRRRKPLHPHVKNVSLRSQFANWLWQSVPLRCASCTRKCLRRLPFFLQRKKGRKERRQNQGFGIPPAGGALPASVPFRRANGNEQISFLAFALPLRLQPRRAPRLCCPSKQGCPLRLSCGAMWASRPTKFYRQPLRRGDPRGRPPGLAPHPLQKSLSLRTSDRFTAVAIRPPSPNPLRISFSPIPSNPPPFPTVHTFFIFFLLQNTAPPLIINYVTVLLLFHTRNLCF